MIAHVVLLPFRIERGIGSYYYVVTFETGQQYLAVQETATPRDVTGVASIVRDRVVLEAQELFGYSVTRDEVLLTAATPEATITTTITG